MRVFWKGWLVCALVLPLAGCDTPQAPPGAPGSVTVSLHGSTSLIVGHGWR
jgi:hypothetical protein